MFPFLHENSEAYRFHSDSDVRHDCVVGYSWTDNYFCPTAIHKESMLPFGIPYFWECPWGEHQLHPSCYESPENGN